VVSAKMKRQLTNAVETHIPKLILVKRAVTAEMNTALKSAEETCNCLAAQNTVEVALSKPISCPQTRTFQSARNAPTKGNSDAKRRCAQIVKASNLEKYKIPAKKIYAE
jgi:hypothetical protein